MLMKYLLELLIFLASSILQIISSVIPGWDHLSILTSAITSLLGMSTQVVNFMYFMFGDFYYVAVLIVPVVLTFKYITVPIFSFLRKFITFGG